MVRKILLFLMIVLLFGLVGCSDPTSDDVSIVIREGIDTIEINQAYQDSGAKAKAFGFIISYEVVSNNVDSSVVGVYEIQYSVTYKEITKTCKRIVTVVDQTAPVAALIAGLDTISRNEIWIDSSVEATDNSGVEPTIIISGSVDTTTVGEYVITYTISDESGNETILYRYVNVVDQTGNLQ